MLVSCNTCKIDKPISDMVKRPDRPNGYRKLCKACKSAANQKSEYKKKLAKYYQDNKASIREKRKIRRNNNINERLANSLRARFRSAFINNHKTGSAIKDLGCSIPELRKHLESKFQEGMSWENYGKWHIDHIKPLSSFDLTDYSDVSLACNYKNLQPLWAEDNLKKGNR